MSPTITTYVEMTSYAQFRPAYIEDPEVVIMEARAPLPAFYRFLYDAVGREYEWFGRLEWSDEQFRDYLASPAVSLWVAYYQGTPAGFIELLRESDDPNLLRESVEPGLEIKYFGLLKDFHGRGLGKHLLSFGVEKAWQEKPVRVWLHTCNHDGPYALSNYQKRGFVIYKQEKEE